MGIFSRKEVLDDDPIAKRIFVAIAILLMELIVVAGMIPRSWTSAQIEKEIRSISDMMGEEKATEVQTKAHTWFNQAFVDTGAYEGSFYFFIPTEEQRRRSKGMEDMGQDNLFPFVEKTLISIWTGVLQSTLRLAHYMMWWPFFLLALIPAVGDAILQRRIKQASFAHASPVRYRFAINAFGAVVFLFFFSLLMPIAVPPVAVPIGFAVAAISASFIFANMQKKL